MVVKEMTGDGDSDRDNILSQFGLFNVCYAGLTGSDLTGLNTVIIDPLRTFPEVNWRTSTVLTVESFPDRL